MSLLKRTTYQPQEVETIAEPKEGFAMVDFKDIDTVIENLTAAEMKLWLYLQKLDRYGDKMKDLPTPQEFAIRLGLSRRTVEKAAFRLDDLGLYTFRVKAWQGANSSAARAHQTAKKMKAAKKERETLKPLQDKGGYLAEDAANLPEDGYLAGDAVNLPEKRLNNRDQPPEPLPQADSKTPHTSSDSSDLDQTLSEGKVELSTLIAGLANEREREKFLEFAEQQAAKCKNPEVVLTEKWIAKNFEELHRKFKKVEAAATQTPDEASIAKQQQADARRKTAEEFLSNQYKDPGRDEKCVPAPQKSAVEPQESAEPREVSNQPKEGEKKVKVGQELIDEIKAKRRKPPKPTEQETDSYVRTNVTPPHD